MSDESLVSVTTFEPGEIVLVSTRDAQFGHIQVPGVVRYAHEGVDQTGAPEGYYSVTLLVVNPQQSYLADALRGATYWDLRPDEMRKIMAMQGDARVYNIKALVEHPTESRSGRVMFMPDDEPKTIEQAVEGHRRIVG